MSIIVDVSTLSFFFLSTLECDANVDQYDKDATGRDKFNKAKKRGRNKRTRTLPILFRVLSLVFFLFLFFLFNLLLCALLPPFCFPIVRNAEVKWHLLGWVVMVCS